jgi:hypothetical protein
MPQVIESVADMPIDAAHFAATMRDDTLLSGGRMPLVRVISTSFIS